MGFLDRLLELADSYMTYRARYVSTPRLVPVLDLLLVDETNPRSVAFQLNALAEHAKALPQMNDMLDRTVEQRVILQCISRIQLADVTELAKTDRRGRRVELDTLLSGVPGSMAELSEVVGRHYFSHADLGIRIDQQMPQRYFET